MFFGFYPVHQHTITIKGAPTTIRDLAGKDSTLFHFTLDDDERGIGTPFVQQARTWFDSVWTILGRDHTP